jgi:hypothetical protein
LQKLAALREEGVKLSELSDHALMQQISDFPSDAVSHLEHCYVLAQLGTTHAEQRESLTGILQGLQERVAQQREAQEQLAAQQRAEQEQLVAQQRAAQRRLDDLRISGECAQIYVDFTTSSAAYTFDDVKLARALRGEIEAFAAKVDQLSRVPGRITIDDKDDLQGLLADVRREYNQWLLALSEANKDPVQIRRAYASFERNLKLVYGQPVGSRGSRQLPTFPSNARQDRAARLQRFDRKMRYAPWRSVGGTLQNLGRLVGNFMGQLFNLVTHRRLKLSNTGLARAGVLKAASAARRASEQASPEAKAAARKARQQRMAREREIRPHIGTIAR